MNQITFEVKDTVSTFAVYIKGLKKEIKRIEHDIRELKEVLHQPHTIGHCSLQSDLVVMKSRSTFLYTLRTALRGKIRDNGFLNADPKDTRSEKEKQDQYLLYWLNGSNYKLPCIFKE